MPRKVPPSDSAGLSGRYLTLIKRFPLRPIKNDYELGRATEIIQKFPGHKPDAGTGEYLDTRIHLANKYDDERHT